MNSLTDPPQTPPALVDMQGILKNEITERSGHAEVLQGRAQPQVKSGKAIEMLQTAAASVIDFKSQRTADLIYRLAMLMLHHFVWRLTPRLLDGEIFGGHAATVPTGRGDDNG